MTKENKIKKRKNEFLLFRKKKKLQEFYSEIP